MDTNLDKRVARPNRSGMRYRHHSIAFKSALGDLSLQPGVSAPCMARELGVNADQIFNWRKLYQAGGLGSVQGTTLLPIEVHDAQGPAHGAPMHQSPQVRRVCMEGRTYPQIPA